MPTRNKRARIAGALRVAALFTVATCFFLATLSAAPPNALPQSGDFWGVHDPSIAKQGGNWYVFATGRSPSGGQIPIRCSKDLMHWRYCGEVFPAIPDWIQKVNPRTKDLWAPDIKRYRNQYRLYYAYSTFGSNQSGIGLAINKTLDPESPDYAWIDKGLVLQSKPEHDYNAIDPNFVVDAGGGTWLAFGSFWSGIKMRRLNEAGMLSSHDTMLYSLAGRLNSSDKQTEKPRSPSAAEAIEAPFIIRHGGFYYLFVSWDLCCRGVKSTYRVMVGRAKRITGPYLDASGKSMLDGGATQILAGNSAWVGPGGQSIYSGAPPDVMVFHAYDANTGKPALQVSTIDWSSGWPAVRLGTGHSPGQAVAKDHP